MWNLVISVVVSIVLHILLVAPFEAIERFLHDKFIEPSTESESSDSYTRYTYPRKGDGGESGSSVQSSPSATKNREELPEPYDKHKRDFPDDSTDAGGKPDEQV